MEKDDGWEKALLTYGFKRANAVFTIGCDYSAATQLFAANAAIEYITVYKKCLFTYLKRQTPVSN